MTRQEFVEFMEDHFDSMRKVFSNKAVEYTDGGSNAFHNFDVAAIIGNTTPQKALEGMWMKHLVSTLDMIKDDAIPPKGLVDEKLGDMINYLLLLKGMYYRDIESKEKWSKPAMNYFPEVEITRDHTPKDLTSIDLTYQRRGKLNTGFHERNAKGNELVKTTAAAGSAALEQLNESTRLEMEKQDRKWGRRRLDRRHWK